VLRVRTSSSSSSSLLWNYVDKTKSESTFFLTYCVWQPKIGIVEGFVSEDGRLLMCFCADLYGIDKFFSCFK
jgi:hypothetical protein